MPPIIAAAAPWVLGIIGSMLPAIVDAFRSGRSPEEAAQIVEPKRREIVDRLIGAGMNRAAAEAMADESIKGELEKAKLPEPMNPWLSAALALGGGIGGAFGGAKLGKMMKGKPPEEDVYKKGFESPARSAAKSGAYDSVTPTPEAVMSDKKLPYTPPPAERGFVLGGATEGPFPSRGRGDFSAEIIGDTGAMRSAPVTVEGPFPRMAQHGDRLSAPYEPRLIGMSGAAPSGGVRSDLIGTPASPTIPTKPGGASQQDQLRFQAEMEALFARILGE